MVQICIFKERYFLLCLHSSVSWSKYETAYELAFLVQVAGPKSGSYLGVKKNFYGNTKCL